MPRIFLIDLLRCIAIIAMISFHIVYDLAVFYGYALDYEHGFWKFVQMVLAGGLFIFVSGWTATVGQRSLNNLLYILFGALLVNIATYIQFGNIYVRFGILHFIFAANLLYILFLQYLSTRRLCFLALLLAFSIQPLAKISVTHEYLVWLDILPQGYQSVDHYPLLPWILVFIAGIAWGQIANIKAQSEFSPKHQQLKRYITICSKRSLVIYVLHQPLIIFALYLLL